MLLGTPKATKMALYCCHAYSSPQRYHRGLEIVPWTTVWSATAMGNFNICFFNTFAKTTCYSIYMLGMYGTKRSDAKLMQRQLWCLFTKLTNSQCDAKLIVNNT